MAPVVGIFLLATALEAAAAAPLQQGPPGDCEVRTSRDTVTNDTLTTLTLMLRGPKGPLPINISITSVRRAQPRPGTPPEIRFEFFMPLLGGTLDYTPPHVVLKLDPGTPHESRAAYSVDPRTAIPAVISVSIPFDAKNLAGLAKASVVHGRVFGVIFELTDRQVRAIQDFAARNAR